MACLLVLVVAAAVLTGPPGKLTHAARMSPAEAFWRAALPGAPMPDAIRELLRPAAAGMDDRPKYHGAYPPPMSFSDNVDAGPPPGFGYDYDARRPKHHDGDNSSLRNEAAAPSAEVLNRVAGARNAAAAVSPTVFFLEDAVRVGAVLPIRIMIPRDTADAAAAAAASPPLRLYTIRAVRAVDGCRFMVCRRGREAGRDGDNDDEHYDAVFGCRATTAPARAYVVGVVGERGETATVAVVCRTGDTSRWSNRARAAFWLLDVKPGGGAAAVCHAALGAQVIPVKNDRSCSSLA